MRLRLLLLLPGAVALSCGLGPGIDLPSIAVDDGISMDGDADGGDGDSYGTGGSSAGTGGVNGQTGGGAETSEHAGAGGEAD